MPRKLQIPDARIEYELDAGSLTGASDIEVLTAAYRPARPRSKVQTGFRLHASGRDAASVTARIRPKLD